ncbi:hypothetical protein [Spiroplasma endosymbiont of Nebria brevicollis]|uniref:hypothetical protein n=1 Tax=Spiroplasma endosymbiont of Nebria brevicollis TaxID=3066284 RepID=UPI00313F27BF
MFATDPVKHGVVDQDLWNFNHTVHNKVNSNQISIFDAIKDKYSLSNLFGFASEGSMIANFKPEGKTSIKDIVLANGSYNQTETDEQTFDVTKKH